MATLARAVRTPGRGLFPDRASDLQTLGEGSQDEEEHAGRGPRAQGPRKVGGSVARRVCGLNGQLRSKPDHS